VRVVFGKEADGTACGSARIACVGDRLVGSRALMAKDQGFHQQAPLADGRAIDFYRRMGFVRAGRTEPMWIFDGDEH
jgi:hypothetical protein